ncbi:MAG: hypothetical protein ACHQ17_01600 [Polyangia bacterium]
MLRRAPLFILPFALALLSFACDAPQKLTVLVGADGAAAVTSFVSYLPGALVQVQPSADPAADLAAARGPRVALTIDLTCGDCFSIDPPTDVESGGAYRVHGGSLLGIQYGLAQLLETGGFRFYHPRQSLVPSSLRLPASAPELGRLFSPDKKLRGLHLHTLHPIEPYFDFWEPSPEHLDGARRVIDWLVKNRGNYLQWPALDNITKDPAALAAWRDHTRAILDYGHARGITFGVGVELFHSGNLQNAFDLVDATDLTVDTHPAVGARLSMLLDGLTFDKVNLSFGEFFGADPDQFVAQLNVAYDELQALRPGMELSAVIHVGNAPNQHVQYQGQDLLYYFLVQFANPAIVPWIHSVMYYNLFEPTGGAYLHDDFSLHRQYLLNRLKAHQPAGYFPEDAYWIAFDNSIPTYLPVYIYSRWLDMTDIDQASQAMGGDPLTQHVIFSSGWEWGYWQNDYATLRMSYTRPDRWQAPIEEMFQPYGDAGAKLASEIAALGTLEHDALIGQKLAPYLASTDFLIEGGYASGIVSQPRRPSFEEVAAMSPADRASFAANVLAPLDALATGTESIAEAVSAIGISIDDPWFSEVRDGVVIDAERVRFIDSLYRAVVAHEGGAPVAALLATADAALADAENVVAHRRAHMHDPDPTRLLVDEDNQTVYQYGYLKEADTLCYWQRERAQTRQLVLGSNESIPGCVLGY